MLTLSCSRSNTHNRVETYEREVGTLILMSVYLTLCLWRHRISQIQLQPEVKVMVDAMGVYCHFVRYISGASTLLVLDLEGHARGLCCGISRKLPRFFYLCKSTWPNNSFHRWATVGFIFRERNDDVTGKKSLSQCPWWTLCDRP